MPVSHAILAYMGAVAQEARVMDEQAKKAGKPASRPGQNKVSDSDLEKVSGGVGGPEDRRPQADDPNSPLPVARVS